MACLPVLLPIYRAQRWRCGLGLGFRLTVGDSHRIGKERGKNYTGYGAAVVGLVLWTVALWWCWAVA